MAKRNGVLNEVPVPNTVPPTDTLYHLSVPALAVALRLTIPFPHRCPGTVDVTDGIAVTVAITGTRVEMQLPLAVST